MVAGIFICLPALNQCLAAKVLISMELLEVGGVVPALF